MSAIEKAVAQVNERQTSGYATIKQKKYPRRERLILAKKPTKKTSIKVAANNQSVEPVSNYFTLPYGELEAEGMVEAAGKRNQLSEEYRAIKRPILSAMDNAKSSGLENGNIIMVTSSVSGEGKTFSAINLAISIAMERDRTVLLVDGDVTNPSAGLNSVSDLPNLD